MDIYDIFQNLRIKDSCHQYRQTKFITQINPIDANRLHEKVDHLSLVCFAMTELLEDLGVSRELLAQKIQEVDLRDGKLDGQFSHPGLECVNCGRVLATRHRQCMYCGTHIQKTMVL